MNSISQRLVELNGFADEDEECSKITAESEEDFYKFLELFYCVDKPAIFLHDEGWLSVSWERDQTVCIPHPDMEGSFKIIHLKNGRYCNIIFKGNGMCNYMANIGDSYTYSRDGSVTLEKASDVLRMVLGFTLKGDICK